jgi:nucleoside phosphorylase
LVSAGFVQALTAQGSGTTTMAAVDEETGAVDQVAHRFGVPFLGIRAASDGHGDPLPDPGFPFSFVIYRQLAGDNAAATTVAFLHAWNSVGRPTVAHARAGRGR